MPVSPKIKGLATRVKGRSTTLIKSALASASGKSRQLLFDERQADSIRNWVISLFVKAIRAASTEQDRIETMAWLAATRETLSDDSLSKLEKAKRIHAATHPRRMAIGVFRGVTEAFENYKKADIPVPLKVAIPITLSAAALVGGSSVGLAGFGSAIGVPALLVIFLGSAGITSILEAFLGNAQAKDYVSVIGAMIARDEVLRRANRTMRQAMTEDIVPPKKMPYDRDTEAIQKMLIDMDPYAFEAHVVSFFQDAGLYAWATKKSNDAGVDGFARHPDGLIVIQCKRYSGRHSVGRPAIQQFKGVIEENDAFRGYVVTTCDFTEEARQSAAKNSRLVLIALDELVNWHMRGINLA